MDAGTKIGKGIACLRRYAVQHGFCLRELTDSEFSAWVTEELARRSNDPLLAQRGKVRDLKKKHWNTLVPLQRNLELAQANYAACKSRERLEQLVFLCHNTEKAIAGLTQALQERQGEKRQACESKLQEFSQKLQAYQAEHEALWQATPEKQALVQAEQELASFQNAIGLTREELLAEDLARRQGQHAESRGDLFEKEVSLVLEKEILPALARRSVRKGEDWDKIAPRLHVLSKVTLGCARAELDYVIVWRPEDDSDAPVEILAIVEVKRNINDVADGFAQRQENLAWFCGERTGYDPALYRTNFFKLGHFDRPACHEENGEKFVFTSSSFRRLQRDRETGYFVDRLCFITRRRPLQGMSGGDYSRFLYHLATDINFDMQDPTYVARLRQWLAETIPILQTVDVVRLYAKHRAWGEQFLILDGR